MRPSRSSLVLVLAMLAVLALGAAAGPALARDLPSHGFIVYKDTLRGMGVTEIRDAATGRVVQRLKLKHKKLPRGSACRDPHYKTYARWPSPPTYLINPDTIPTYLDSVLARAELVTSQEAWEGRFTTNCKVPRGRNSYDAADGGDTDALPTLVTDLADDGQNTVGFVSLAGTVCEGALACVVADYDRHRIHEADLALEEDLTSDGFQDFWTTKPTTWTDSTGGEFAISDVATHEFGHFAGLDHVQKSPELTMYPFIHDGDDTLGRGDMRGLLSLY